MKTHSEADIRKLFKQQGYKYASMRNAEGKTIVTYNTENNPKIKAADKINEAFERLKVLPDGIYTFLFANSKGRNVAPDEFAFLKGNVVLDENGKGAPFQIIHQMPTNAPKNDFDKILSYPEVLSLQMELTTLKFKLQNTEAELAKANATIVSLEKEVADLEAKGLGEDTSPLKWVENLSSALLPVADRYFGIKERELDLQERGVRRPKPQQQKKRPAMPEIGSAEFEQWLDKLSDLPDEQYQKAMYNIRQVSPDHYNAIIAELESDEDETETP